MDIMIDAFERCNGSEYFEFIERVAGSPKGGKCKLKCKACGSVFDTWQIHEIHRGHKNKITCPDCGMSSDGTVVFSKSPQLGELLKYYTEGHTVRETAEKFGLSKVRVNNYVKTHKVSNGRSFRDGPSEHNKKQAKEAEERLKAILESKGFLYCGGYAHKTGRVKITCKTCGSKFTNHIDTVQHGVVICPACEHERVLARQAERKAELAKQAEERKQLQELERQRVEAEKALALFHLLNDKTHICTVCGKSFSIADYMKDCDLKQIQHNPIYCSDACKRRANHRKSKECKKRSENYDRGNHRHRARKYGVAYEPGITLKKVFKRDNGICQICGKPCDWSDRRWNKYCGPTYPSTDHIIPLDKGGGHIWENVQLAHMMCNSEKGDKLLKAVIS